MTQLNHEWRTARKPHQCEECGCAIKPGERYLYYCGKDDSEFYSGYHCSLCEHFIDEYKINADSDLDDFYTIQDWVDDAQDHDMTVKWNAIRLRDADVIFFRQLSYHVIASGVTDTGKAYIKSKHGVESVTLDANIAAKWYRDENRKPGVPKFRWKEWVS